MNTVATLTNKTREIPSAGAATNFALSCLFSAILAGIGCSFGFNNPLALIFLTLALVPAFYLMIDSCQRDGQTALTLFVAMYIIFSLILPGFIHTASDHYPFYRMSYPEKDIESAALIIFSFNVSLLIGYLIYQQQDRSTPITSARLDVGFRAIGLGTALSAVAFAGFLALGPSKFLVARRDLGAELTQFSALLQLSLVRFLAFTGFATLLGAVAARREWSKPALPLLIASGVVFFLANYPIAIPRFVLFAYIISLSVTFLGLWKKKFKVVTAFLYPLLLTTIFPVISNLSRGRIGGELLTNPLEYYSTTGDFDGFQSTINVFRWIDSTELQGGKQLLSALLVFIPRDFWPEKALPTGMIAARVNGYLFTNISCPLPAELYSDFGWVGTIVGGGLIGLLLGKANRWATVAQTKSKLADMTTYGLMAGFSTILLRGSLIAVIAVCALAMIVPQLQRLIERAPRARN